MLEDTVRVFTLLNLELVENKLELNNDNIRLVSCNFKLGLI